MSRRVAAHTLRVGSRGGRAPRAAHGTPVHEQELVNSMYMYIYIYVCIHIYICICVCVHV